MPVVACSNNHYQLAHTRQGLNGLPESLADPEQGKILSNLILAGGIDKNTRLSPLNPYRPWMARAPGWDLTTAGAGLEDMEFDIDGASVGKHLFLLFLVSFPRILLTRM